MRIKHKGAVLGFVLILLSMFWLIFLWDKLPSVVPWLYSLPEGEKQLVSKLWFGGSLGIMAFVFLIDVLLGFWLGKKDKILTDLVIWFGVGLIVIGLASFFRVLMIVI